jgi:hypothetical protein
MSELIELPASASLHAQGSGLQAVLEAESRASAWARRRVLCGRLVIGLSLPLSYFLYRGQGLDNPSARFAFVLSILALACSSICAVAVLQAERALDALVTRAGGRRIQIDVGENRPHARS